MMELVYMNMPCVPRGMKGDVHMTENGENGVQGEKKSPGK